MAKSNNLDVRLNAQANITNIDKIKKDLGKVMDGVKLDKGVENNLNKIMKKMDGLSKTFDIISKKSIFSDKDFQTINKATNELESNVKEISALMKTINMDNIIKSTDQYKKLMSDITEEATKLKQSFKDATGLNFDKEIKNLSTIKHNINELTKAKEQLQKTGVSDEYSRLLDAQNSKLQSQQSQLQALKELQSEILNYQNQMAQSKGYDSFNSLQKVATTRTNKSNFTASKMAQAERAEIDKLNKEYADLEKQLKRIEQYKNQASKTRAYKKLSAQLGIDSTAIADIQDAINKMKELVEVTARTNVNKNNSLKQEIADEYQQLVKNRNVAKEYVNEIQRGANARVAVSSITGAKTTTGLANDIANTQATAAAISDADDDDLLKQAETNVVNAVNSVEEQLSKLTALFNALTGTQNSLYALEAQEKEHLRSAAESLKSVDSDTTKIANSTNANISGLSETSQKSINIAKQDAVRMAQAIPAGQSIIPKTANISGVISPLLEEVDNFLAKVRNNMANGVLDEKAFSGDDWLDFRYNIIQINKLLEEKNAQYRKDIESNQKSIEIHEKEITEAENRIDMYKKLQTMTSANLANKSPKEVQAKVQQQDEKIKGEQLYITNAKEQIKNYKENIQVSQDLIETNNQIQQSVKGITQEYEGETSAIENLSDADQKRLALDKARKDGNTELITKLSQEIDNSERLSDDRREEIKTIQDLVNAKNQLDNQTKAMSESLRRESEQLSNSSAINKTFKETLGQATTFATTYLSINAIINRTFSLIRSGLGQIKEMDDSITQIGIVTNKTAQEVWASFNTYNSQAQRLNMTTTELLDATKLYYQQGLNTAEVNQMVEATAVAAALGEVEMGEAANTLTSIMNGYNMAATQAMDVTDKISAVGADSAADFGELSTAIEKTASSAATAGIDLDHLLGYLGKMVEVTREAPSNIGSAMKSIVSRMAELKEDPTKALEDGTDVNKVQTALATVGIQLFDTQNQMRELDDVIDELGGKWNTLSRNSQAYIATVIAGNRQQSRFLALMNNYDRTLDLVASAQNSAGRSSQQFRNYTTGLEASLNSIRAQAEKFYVSLTNGSGSIKVVYNLFNNLLNVVNKLGPALSIGGTALTAFFAKMAKNINDTKNQKNFDIISENIANSLKSDIEGKIGSFNVTELLAGTQRQYKTERGQKIGQKFSNVFGAQGIFNKKNSKQLKELNGLIEQYNNGLFKNVSVATNVAEISEKQAAAIHEIATSTGYSVEQSAAIYIQQQKQTLGTKLLTSSMWANVAAQAAMTVGISLLVAGATSLITWLSDMNAGLREEIANAEEAAQKASDEANSLETLIGNYEELNNKLELSSEEKEELQSVTKEIIDQYPELLAGMDSEGKAYLKNTEYLRKYLKEKEKESAEKKKEAATKQLELGKKTGSTTNGIFFNTNPEDTYTEEQQEQVTKMQNLRASLPTSFTQVRYASGVNVDEFLRMIGHNEITTDEARQALKDSTNIKDEDLRKKIEQYIAEKEKLNALTVKGAREVNQNIISANQELKIEEKNLTGEQSIFVNSLASLFTQDYIAEQTKDFTTDTEVNDWVEQNQEDLTTNLIDFLTQAVTGANGEKIQTAYDEYVKAQSEGLSGSELDAKRNALFDLLQGVTKNEKDKAVLLKIYNSELDKDQENVDEQVEQVLKTLGISKEKIDEAYKRIQEEGEYYGEDVLKKNSNQKGIKSTSTGNIDLNKRKVVMDELGNYMTEESTTFAHQLENGDWAAEVIPTVYDGQRHSVEEAIQHYYDTHETLGQFILDGITSEEEANAYLEEDAKNNGAIERYAQQIHEVQEEKYGEVANILKTEGNYDDMYQRISDVFKNQNTQVRQKIFDSIQAIMNDDSLFNGNTLQRNQFAQKMVVALTETMNDKNIGPLFQTELNKLDINNAVDVKAFKEKWSASLLEFAGKAGMTEEQQKMFVDKLIPNPGSMINDALEGIKKSLTDAKVINDKDIQELFAGDYDLTEALEDGFDLGEGTVIGDKFIANTNTVVEKLGEANEALKKNIEALKISALEDAETAIRTIEEAKQKIESIKTNAQKEGRDLTASERTAVEEQQKSIAQEEKLIELLHQRVNNAEKLTEQYKEQVRQQQLLSSQSFFNTYDDGVNQQIQSLKDLASAYNDIKEGELSQLDIIEMIANNTNLLTAVYVNERGELALNKQALEELAKAKINDALVDGETKVQQLKNLKSMIQADETYTAERRKDMEAKVQQNSEFEKDVEEMKDRIGDELQKDASQWDSWVNGLITNVLPAFGRFLSQILSGISGFKTKANNILSKVETYFNSIADGVNGKSRNVDDMMYLNEDIFQKELRATGSAVDKDGVLNILIGGKRDDSADDTYIDLSNVAGSNTTVEKWRDQNNYEDDGTGISGAEYIANIDKQIAEIEAVNNALRSMRDNGSILESISNMGGSDSKSNKKDFEAYMEYFEKFYNYMKQIQNLDAKINRLREKRNIIDANKNYYINDLKQENQLLASQAKLYNDYIRAQSSYLAGLRQQISSAYGDLAYFTDEGMLQLKVSEVWIESESTEDRIKEFQRLMQEYESQYETMQDNETKLYEIQNTQLKNITAMYDKLLQRLQDVRENLEFIQSISEHKINMSYGNLETLDLLNDKLETTISLWNNSHNIVSMLEGDMQAIASQVKSSNLGQFLQWDQDLNQYRITDAFYDDLVKQQWENMGADWSEVTTWVTTTAKQSEEVAEKWREAKEQLMDSEETLKSIVEDRLSRITDVISDWTGEISDLFDLLNRTSSLLQTKHDLFGMRPGDYVDEFDSFVSSAMLAKTTMEDLRKQEQTTLNELIKKYGDYITATESGIEINETAIKESTSLSKVQKAEAAELIAIYNGLEDAAESVEDQMYDSYQQALQMLEEQRDARAEILDSLYDMLKGRDQEELDDLQKKYDEMSRLDTEYYNSLKQKIQDARDLRDFNQQANQTDQMRARIAVMQQGNTSQYNEQLIELQRQLNEQLQQQADAEVDRELERIEREQQQRQEDRDLQLQQMENLITFKDENGLYWQEAMALVESGQQEVMSQLTEWYTTQNGNFISRQQQLEDLQKRTDNAFVDLGITWGTETGRNISDRQVQVGILQNAMSNLNSSVKKNGSDVIGKIGNHEVSVNRTFSSESSNIRSKVQSVTDYLAGIDYGISNSLSNIYNTRTELWQRLQNIVDAINNASNAANQRASSYLSSFSGGSSGGSSSSGGSRSSSSDNYGGGDGIARVGDRVTFVSGSYYNDSYGSRPVGWQHQGEEVYITNTNPGARKPVHISTGPRLGYGDLGWLTLEQLRGYSEGGYVNTTGPVMVHGTDMKPEAFLNARQTSLFEELRDVLVRFNSYKNKDKDENEQEGIAIENLNVNVQEIADMGTLIKESIGQMKNEIMSSIEKQTAMKVRRR